MNPQKTGQYIRILRKQEGLTQRELAEAVGVTDKAVSRWERGRGFPDISLLTPLAQALHTTVAELMAGEPLTEQERAAQSNSALIEALRYTGGMARRTLAVLTAGAGAFLLLLPLFMAGRTLPLRLAGAALLLLSFVLFWGRGFSLLSRRWNALADRLFRRSTARAAAALFLLFALVLEIIPGGAVLNFGRPAGDGGIGFFREAYSCFSLTPVGYGSFFPFLTGVFTAVLLPLSLLRLRRDSRPLGNGIFIGTVAAAAVSLLPLLLFGADYFSSVAAGITLCLVLSAGAAALANR